MTGDDIKMDSEGFVNPDDLPDADEIPTFSYTSNSSRRESNEEMSKPLPQHQVTKGSIIRAMASAFGTGHIAIEPRKKKQTSIFEQQRRINQAEERRAKKRAKRLKHYNFNHPGG